MGAAPIRLGCAVLLLAAAPAAAQQVRGRMVEEGSTRPVAGAIIVGVDSAGHDVVRVLTNADGRFVLSLPHPGTWRLRGERIGFRSSLSRPIPLAAGEVANTVLPAPAEPVQLEAIEVKSARRCTVRPAEGRATARVWDEARKALETAALTSRQRLLRFDLVRSERRLDPRTLTVLRETHKELTAYSDNPIRSLPAANLADSGYVRMRPDGSTDFYAPDATVLLSDLFLDTHCMRLADDDPPAPGLIGLAFEPVKGRHARDIEGVLWLDRATAELRSLDFHYTNLPQPVDVSQVGGHIDFERVRGGGWIVRRWWIRMPVVRERLDYFNRQAIQNSDLAALQEAGGEVTRIEGAGPGALSAAARAAVHGTVWDSATAAPLAGADVFLSGTSWAATTDSAGRYRIENVPPGAYTVSFSDTALENLGVPATPVRVDLHAGDEATADLAAPSTATALAAVCAPDARGDTTGFAFGVVRDSATGRPAPGATVTLTWTWYGMRTSGGRTEVDTTPLGVQVEADGRGRWKVCRLQAGRTIAIAAAWGRHASPAATFEVARRGWARKDLRVGLAPARRADLAAITRDALRPPRATRSRATPRPSTPKRAGEDVDAVPTGNIITRATIEAIAALDVFDALRRMAPLRVSGTGSNVCVTPVHGPPGSLTDPLGTCHWPLIYVDGAPLPIDMDPGALAALDISSIERIEYLPPELAATRYGTDATFGALLITTRHH